MSNETAFEVFERACDVLGIETVCILIDINRRTVQRMRSGDKRLSPHVLNKLADALDRENLPAALRAAAASMEGADA